jgi:Protein of unknown function (DUF2752)
MKQIFLGLGLAGGLVAALILFLFDPTQVPIYPVCLFHQYTGLDCPSCGSLRALHQLLHGHWIAAFHFNAFLMLSLPLFGWLGLRYWWRTMTHQPPVTWRPIWLWLYVAAFIAFGVVRNLPVPCLAWFGP